MEGNMGGKMIVFTAGTFDLFHAGHVNFLKLCARFGKVTVALSTDKFVKEFKGAFPIMTYGERESVLLGCKYVNEVIVNMGGKNIKPAVELVEPDLIIVGSDWAKKDIYKQYSVESKKDREWLNQFLIYIPYTKSISSSEIKRRIKNG